VLAAQFGQCLLLTFERRLIELLPLGCPSIDLLAKLLELGPLLAEMRAIRFELLAALLKLGGLLLDVGAGGGGLGPTDGDLLGQPFE